MKKPEIARRLARKSGLTPGEAADHLDRMVHRILTDLRRGRPANLPGLGRFHTGSDGRICFEPAAENRRA